MKFDVQVRILCNPKLTSESGVRLSQPLERLDCFHTRQLDAIGSLRSCIGYAHKGRSAQNKWVIRMSHYLEDRLSYNPYRVTSTRPCFDLAKSNIYILYCPGHRSVVICLFPTPPWWRTLPKYVSAATFPGIRPCRLELQNHNRPWSEGPRREDLEVHQVENTSIVALYSPPSSYYYTVLVCLKGHLTFISQPQVSFNVIRVCHQRVVLFQPRRESGLTS